MYNVFPNSNFTKALVGAGVGYFIFKLACNCANSNKKEGVSSRDDLSEKDIDEMVVESFPASDSPSTY